MPASGQVPGLSDPQWQWLGAKIYANECAGRFDCLTSWNAGEEFPSLGIGHFIWYPAGTSGRFEETFPQLLQYLVQHQRQRHIDVPVWLLDAADSGAPWPDRETFLAQFESVKMGQLRRLLADTQPQQVEFISRRFFQSLPTLVEYFPPPQRQEIEEKIAQLAAASPPLGLYALIDYLHFKGSGLHASERYQGQGWGLVQVLAQMPASASSLESFVSAAETVLRRRVANAPPARDEGRWLDGWLARIQTYQAPAEAQ